MHRRDFLTTVTMGMGMAVISPSLLAQQTTAQTGSDKPAKPPQFADDLVRDFVSAGHGDIDKVKQMLAEHPNLLYATWDWGGGDFETALEGAGHTGNKNIANYLIGLGARPNLFVLTMLGREAVVKATLEDFPALLHAKGPHGFTLLHHAWRGGPEAAGLYAYLESKGLKEKNTGIV